MSMSQRLLLTLILLTGLSATAWCGDVERTMRDSLQTALADTLATDSPSGAKGDQRMIPAEIPEAEAAEMKSEKSFSPNPTVAVLCGIIPGGGQIYNRKYWKLPIIIGGATALYYAISWNNNNLTEYANAYRDIKSDDPMTNDSWVAFVPAGADPESYRTNGSFQETLRHGRDFYRRNRDLSIIIAVGVYALSIIDAYVDAELAHFDISPDLTLQAAPTYIPSSCGTGGGPGLRLAFSF